MVNNGYDGSDAHKHLIYFARHYLMSEGWTMCDYRAIFKESIVPFIPDLLCRRSGRRVDEKGRAHQTLDLRFIEIELNPTAASRKRKNEHAAHWTGWNLLILDARKIRGIRKGWAAVTMGAIDDWLREWL